MNSSATFTAVSSALSLQPLILAAASVRSLAESAVAAGFRVIAADCFADRDLVDFLLTSGGQYLGRITRFSELPRILESLPESIPLLWAGGLENHCSLLRQISHRRPLAGLPLTAVETLRSPLALSEVLGTGGPVLCPESCSGQIPSHGRWLWKSTESGGGMGIQRLAPELPDALETTLPGLSGYFQREVDGLPVSAIACCDGHETSVVGMALQWSGWHELGAEDFRFCGNLGPLIVPPRLMAAVQDAAAKFFRLVGSPRGIVGLDMLLAPDRCWLLEVNPRIPASAWIYETAIAPHAWNSVRWLLRGAPTERFEADGRLIHTNSVHRLRSQLILWSRRNFVVPDLHVLSAELPPRVRIADRPASGDLILPNSPVCSLLCEADDPVQLTAAINSLPARLMSAVSLDAGRISGASSIIGNRG